MTPIRSSAVTHHAPLLTSRESSHHDRPALRPYGLRAGPHTAGTQPRRRTLHTQPHALTSSRLRPLHYWSDPQASTFTRTVWPAPPEPRSFLTSPRAPRFFRFEPLVSPEPPPLGSRPPRRACCACHEALRMRVRPVSIPAIALTSRTYSPPFHTLVVETPPLLHAFVACLVTPLTHAVSPAPVVSHPRLLLVGASVAPRARPSQSSTVAHRPCTTMPYCIGQFAVACVVVPVVAFPALLVCFRVHL